MLRIRTAGIHSFFLCAECGDDILPGQQYKMRGKKKSHLNPRCSMSGSQPVFEPIPFDEKWCNLEENRGGRDRCLRTYSREHAEKDYTCHRCSHDPAFNREPDLAEIWVGDSYYAEVWIIDGKIEVRRFHEHCPFPPYDEEEEYGCEVEEDEWEDELPLAA